LEKRILTIVGRAKNPKEFQNSFKEFLDDNFNVEGIHSLGEFYEVDGNERFIAFVSENITEEQTSNISYVVHSVRSEGYASETHDSLEEALEYARERYHLEDDDVKAQEKFAEIRERFPNFSAEEWEQFNIFDSLYHTGKIIPIRGRLDDELVMVIVTVAHGSDEIRVTPLAIIASDSLQMSLELPFSDSE